MSSEALQSRRVAVTGAAAGINQDPAPNAKLGGHQQIRGSSVWPDEDFPRTPSMKVRKPEVLLEAPVEFTAATIERVRR